MIARMLVCLVLLGLLTFSIQAETNGDLDLFKGLQINYQAMSWVDYGFTVVALGQHEARELNPIARLYIERSELAIPIKLTLNLTVYWISSVLYKKGKKFWAYSLVIFATVVQMVVFRNNVMEITR